MIVVGKCSDQVKRFLRALLDNEHVETAVQADKFLTDVLRQLANRQVKADNESLAAVDEALTSCGLSPLDKSKTAFKPKDAIHRAIVSLRLQVSRRSEFVAAVLSLATDDVRRRAVETRRSIATETAPCTSTDTRCVCLLSPCS